MQFVARRLAEPTESAAEVNGAHLDSVEAVEDSDPDSTGSDLLPCEIAPKR
jgi:hypothetical protein